MQTVDQPLLLPHLSHLLALLMLNRAAMQDCNLVLYNANGVSPADAVWASNTATGAPRCQLEVVGLPEYVDGGFISPVTNLVRVINPDNNYNQVIGFPMAAPAADLATIGPTASATLGVPYSTPATVLPGPPEMMHDHQQARACAVRKGPLPNR